MTVVQARVSLAAARLLHRKAEDAALVDEFDAFCGAGVQAPIGDLAAIGDQIAGDAIAAREGA